MVINPKDSPAQAVALQTAGLRNTFRDSTNPLLCPERFKTGGKRKPKTGRAPTTATPAKAR